MRLKHFQHYTYTALTLHIDYTPKNGPFVNNYHKDLETVPVQCLCSVSAVFESFNTLITYKLDVKMQCYNKIESVHHIWIPIS